MCLFCHKHDDYSLDHLQKELSKSTNEDLLKKSKAIKHALKNYEVWLNSDHLDGFERAAIEQTVSNLKNIQEILMRKL